VSEPDEHLSKRVRNISDRVVGVNALRALLLLACDLSAPIST
jgi:hypothetical protein